MKPTTYACCRLKPSAPARLRRWVVTPLTAAGVVAASVCAVTGDCGGVGACADRVTVQEIAQRIGDWTTGMIAIKTTVAHVYAGTGTTYAMYSTATV